MDTIIRGVIGIVVGLFVTGALLGTSMQSISNVSLYLGVNSAVIVVATVLIPIVACVSIALMFLPHDL